MNQPANPQGQSTSINIHQQKLFSLILGALSLVGLILPWATQGGGFGGSISVNGFQGWGILSLFGLVGVIVSSLLGDKTKVYDQNLKYVAIGGFAAITLGAFIYFMQISGSGNGIMGIGGVKSGIGLWFCIISGILGILWAAGVIKFTPPPPRTNSPNPPTPPAPPPPPPSH